MEMQEYPIVRQAKGFKTNPEKMISDAANNLRAKYNFSLYVSKPENLVFPQVSGNFIICSFHYTFEFLYNFIKTNIQQIDYNYIQNIT